MSITLMKIANHIVTPALPDDLCMWCTRVATVRITDSAHWVDWACERHAIQHFSATVVKPNPRCGNCGGRGCDCADKGKGWA